MNTIPQITRCSQAIITPTNNLGMNGKLFGDFCSVNGGKGDACRLHKAEVFAVFVGQCMNLSINVQSKLTQNLDSLYQATAHCDKYTSL